MWTTVTLILEWWRVAFLLYVLAGGLVTSCAPPYRRVASGLQGKYLNNGQVCIAPDYVLVTVAAYDRLIAALKAALVSFYGENPQSCKDLGRVINERHFDRVAGLLASHTGQVGGLVPSACWASALTHISHRCFLIE